MSNSLNGNTASFLERFRGRTSDFPRLSESIVLIVAVILIQFVVGIILVVALESTVGKVSPFDPRLISVYSFFSFLSVAYCASRRNSDSFRRIFPVGLFSKSLLFSVTVFALGFSVLSREYLVTVSQYAHWYHPNWLNYSEIFRYGFYSAGSLILVAPVCEEIFFRGLLLNSFAKIYSRRNAIGLNALLFALLHWNLDEFLPLFLMGVFLSWLRIGSSSLLPCIYVHALLNLCAYMSYKWYLSHSTAYTLSQVICVGLFASLAALLGLYLTWKNVEKARRAPPDCEAGHGMEEAPNARS